MEEVGKVKAAKVDMVVEQRAADDKEEADCWVDLAAMAEKEGGGGAPSVCRARRAVKQSMRT